MLELPHNIESVEKITINKRLNSIEIIALINNEKVKNTRIKFKALLVSWETLSEE